MFLEHQAIADLTGLRERCQQAYGAQGIDRCRHGRRQTDLHQFQRLWTAIDQGQHVSQVGAAGAGGRLMGGGQIEQMGIPVQHRPNPALAFLLEGRQFHEFSSSRRATARVQPAEAPRILTGKQASVKP